jgi:hypothetical protein
MASDHGATLRKWIAEAEEVPIVPPRPCLDSEWEMDPPTFKEQHPGKLHMHSTLLKLLQIFNIAKLGKTPPNRHWLTLFKLDLAKIIIADGADPDKTIDDGDIEGRLIRAVCISFGQEPYSTSSSNRDLVPNPKDLSFIRQFALNLACSSPTGKKNKQLMFYMTSLQRKSNLH